jgi:glycosyltransferase 2 family protein
MKRKHFLTFAVILVLLAALVYLQIREWRKFDWATFAENTATINWLQILLAVVLIHCADFLRSIRWKIFLRPTCPETPWKCLVAPQFIGFAGMALFGRPGELIRPYLIALRAKTTFSSQLALWFVERAFDTGAVALILAIDLFLVPQMRRDFSDDWFIGYIVLGFFFALVGALYAVWRRGPQISSWFHRKVAPHSESLAQVVEQRVKILSEGLHAVRDWNSLLQASGISFLIWMLVGLSYRQILHAFDPSTGLSDFGLPQGILLLGASVAGGVAQLPFIGGGAQLATVAILSRSFDYSDRPEIAVVAGLMFWLVTYVSVAPLGLILARYEHISLRKLTRESEREAERQENAPGNGR